MGSHRHCNILTVWGDNQTWQLGCLNQSRYVGVYGTRSGEPLMWCPCHPIIVTKLGNRSLISSYYLHGWNTCNGFGWRMFCCWLFVCCLCWLCVWVVVVCVCGLWFVLIVLFVCGLWFVLIVFCLIDFDCWLLLRHIWHCCMCCPLYANKLNNHNLCWGNKQKHNTHTRITTINKNVYFHICAFV